MLPSYRNKLRAFMEGKGIWHICEMDYPARVAYEQLLKKQFCSTAYTQYVRAMDLVKLHSIKSQVRTVRERGRPTAEYEGGILFLPYHPDPEIAGQFIDSSQKKELAWDFGQEAPENMKRQVFDSLHYILENFREDQRQFYLRRLKKLYGFCIARKVDDIDGIELVQIKEFEETMQAEGEKKPTAGIVDICRKAL